MYPVDALTAGFESLRTSLSKHAKRVSAIYQNLSRQFADEHQAELLETSLTRSVINGIRTTS